MLDEVVEPLAELMHEIWANWTTYMLDCLFANEKLRKRPRAHVHVERWKRQKVTPYEELADTEKDSDRSQAYKIIKALVSI